jgi:transcriptional regulator with XRE-family HTH domain
LLPKLVALSEPVCRHSANGVQMTPILMPYDKLKIAELVKASRLAKGYTQLELSEATQISLRSVQRIENGEVLPRLYTIKVLAAQLNFDYNLAALPEESFAKGSMSVELIKSTSRPRQVILSIGIALLLLLTSGAFLSQTTRFPETNFESFSFWAVVLLAYVIALWRIWK